MTKTVAKLILFMVRFPQRLSYSCLTWKRHFYWLKLPVLSESARPTPAELFSTLFPLFSTGFTNLNGHFWFHEFSMHCLFLKQTFHYTRHPVKYHNRQPCCKSPTLLDLLSPMSRFVANIPCWCGHGWPPPAVKDHNNS